MTHLELPLLHHLGDFGRELEQSQQIADRGAGSAHRIGGLLMRDAELRDQPFECARLFQRIQVLALDVLDQRHRDGRFVGHAADDGGNASSSPAICAARQRRSPAMIS